MRKAVIIYGSTTGNTELAADMIGNVLRENGLETVIKDVSTVSVEELSKDYDLILLGSSTWGMDEIELQDDFDAFYESMDIVTLRDRKVAVFGCGDSSYQYFCGAVDAIQDKVEKLGGIIVTEGLRIDGDPGSAKDEIVEWAEALAKTEVLLPYRM